MPRAPASKPAVRSKPSVKGEATSETRILEAYIELCHTIGVANITLQKIADQADVAFGTVRYYFASDEKAIHDEAFKLMMRNAYEVVESLSFELRRKRDYNPVLAYIETMFEWIFARPSQGSFLLYMYYLSSTEEELGYGASTTIEKARFRVESLIHEAVGMGLYRQGLNAKRLASDIHALAVGYGFIALTFRDKKVLDAHKALCKQAVESLLNAQST